MTAVSETAGEVPGPAAVPELFKGYIDGLSPNWRIVGWARPLGALEQERLTVQLVENAVILDTCTADIFRGDLLEADIGDGRFGFSLRIPQRLFDGFRHSFTIRVAELDGPGVIGDLEVALPHRSTGREQACASITGAELLQAVWDRPAAHDFDPVSQAGELTRVLDRIAEAYDHATALGCLYVHVLRRRIDADGLQTRLTRLSKSPAELEAVIREVLASDEARNLYRSGAENRFPDIRALDVWTKLRRMG